MSRIRAGRGVAIGCVLMCMGALSPGHEAPPMPADRVIAQLLARRGERRQDDLDLAEMARRKQLLDQIRSRPVEFIEPLRKALDLAGSVREVGLESTELVGPFTRAWGAIHLLSPLGPEHAAPLLVGAFADCRGVLEQGRARTGELRALANAAEADAEAIAAIHQRIDRLVRREGTLLSMMADHVRVAGQLKTPILVDPILSHYEAGLSDEGAEWPRYVLSFAWQREDIVPRLERIVADPKADPAIKLRIKRGLDWHAEQLAGVDARKRGARAPGAASAIDPDAKPGPTR